MTLAAVHLVLALPRIEGSVLLILQIVNNVKMHGLTLDREAPNCTLTVSIKNSSVEFDTTLKLTN